MPKIFPYFWFGDGKAEEAVRFYVSLFPNAEITMIRRYGNSGPCPPGSVMMLEFTLAGQECMAINGPPLNEGDSTEFRGGISLFVDCASQAELDGLWERLADGGKKMPCGWVLDRYGFAWNLVPAGVGRYLAGEDEAGAERAMQAMMKMQKIDVDALRAAYESTTDQIKKQAIFHLPLDRIWRAISDAQEFGAWFGAEFDGSFSVGREIKGKIRPTRMDPEIAKMQEPHAGMPITFAVERIEPMCCFSYYWHPFAIDPTVDYSEEPMTLITFTLAPADSGTLLTVTEAGFDALPPERRSSAFSAHEQGWAMQLQLLEKYLESVEVA